MNQPIGGTRRRNEKENKTSVKSMMPTLSWQRFLSYPWEVISNKAREAWEFRINRIWPKVAPKPTREEVAGRIVVAFRNDVLTVITLDGMTVEVRLINFASRTEWQSVFISSDGRDSWNEDRDEAEQAAKDMLVDAALQSRVPKEGD